MEGGKKEGGGAIRVEGGGPNSLEVLLPQCLVSLVVFLHFERDLVDGALELGRHFFPPILLLSRSLLTLLLRRLAVNHTQLSISVGGTCMYSNKCLPQLQP